jgi:Ribbon-helix-helix protein, copG family
MSRMRRIQVVIDPELDDRLDREAARRGLSKSALVRLAVERELSEPFDNGLWRLPVFDDVEPVENIDELLYGPISDEAGPSSIGPSDSLEQSHATAAWTRRRRGLGMASSARTASLLRRRDNLRAHAQLRIREALAFDGDFAAAGFVELRP